MVDERDRSDAALDRLITEALDVEVTPEFVTRVRTQVAHERAHRSWRGAWALVPVALGALAVVWLVSPFDRSGALPDPVASAAVAVALAPSIESRPVPASPTVVTGNATDAPVVARPTERRVEARRPTVANGPAVEDQPAIIIDVREGRALQALITRIREGRIDASPLHAPQVSTEELHTADIVIPPLAVPLLTFSADIHKAAEELE